MAKKRCKEIDGLIKILSKLKEKKYEDEFDKAELKENKKAYIAEVKATETNGEGNPPSWVAEESKWEKAKRASKKAFGEVKWEFVTWFYLSQLGGKRK